MTKKIICRVLRGVGILLGLYLLYTALTCTLVPLAHPAQAPELPAAAEPTETRVRCIDDNGEALLFRLKLIEEAKEEIILASFDLRDDTSGTDILSALYAAADRGVQVRILLDGLNGDIHLRHSATFRCLAAHENVEVRFYNPFSLFLPYKINYRMHDKYLIADKSLCILGGRNTNDLFLGDYADTYNIDRDILLYAPEGGGVVQDVRGYFEAIYALPASRPFGRERHREKAAEALRGRYAELRELYPAAFSGTDYAAATLPTDQVRLLTNPQNDGNKYPLLWEALCREMEQGENILIQTPYIICNERMYADLAALTAGGRQVRVLTNAVENGANPWGCSDLLREKDHLLSLGIGLYETICNQSLHTKTILIDHDLSIVGSFNADMRSAYLDTELMLCIQGQEVNRTLREATAPLLEQSVLSENGTVTPGADYVYRDLPAGKWFVYRLLSVLLRPFRQLL